MATILDLRVRNIEAAGPRAIVVQVDLAGREFDYRAGQAVWLGRPDRDTRVPYSIACSPAYARATGSLEFLVRTDSRGGDASRLDAFESGRVVTLSGPIGRFTLASPLDASALIFVAGGVGIAPLRAMMQEAVSSKNSPRIALLYSARTSAEFAFPAEFDALAEAGRLRVVRTATRETTPAAAVRGRITRDMLAQLDPGKDALCYVSGPDSFLEHVAALLGDLGVSLDRIRREE